jgi:dTDP-4-dehydrorhamnose reductase
LRVAVVGSNGQLGSDVCSAFEKAGDDVARIAHIDIEICSESSVDEVLGDLRPNFVVNTAAVHHIEKCEVDPGKSFAVNGIGARNVARWAAQNGAAVAYISTDYVFSGNKRTPYLESDLPAPLNVYGVTKLAGEQFSAQCNPRHFILRVSGLYGLHPCRAKGGLNFVELMLKLAQEREVVRVVDDEYVSPTPTDQVAEQLVRLSRTDAHGLYHATTKGSCSWYEFAEEIFAISGVKVRLEKALPGEFPAKVPRPKYSVLQNAALDDRDLNSFTDWREGLHRYMNARRLIEV